ncbi:hypothetical protein Dimus_015741, partial [Dionaea muscipula]
YETVVGYEIPRLISISVRLIPSSNPVEVIWGRGLDFATSVDWSHARFASGDDFAALPPSPLGFPTFTDGRCNEKFKLNY